MPIIIQMFSSQSPNVVCFTVDEAGEIVHARLDPVCPACKVRNEPGCNFCAHCGERLRLASKATTRPLLPPPTATAEPDASPTVDLSPTAPPDDGGYEGASEPNECHQQKQVSLCGEALREIIKRMNLLQHWYNHSPAEKGVGIHESRFRALSETKDLLLRLDRYITSLITEEFKSKR
ncbi:MAG TPA: hypothetical protein VJZ91_17525 [Blastocatellia bacterium]|nr:hypothetical protein [Blastocatellia bacterium]